MTRKKALGCSRGRARLDKEKHDRKLSMQREQSHYSQNSPIGRSGMCPATSSSSTVLQNLIKYIAG